MRYKPYTIYQIKGPSSHFDVDIGWIIHSYDQAGDRVIETSPYKDKVIVEYRTDIVQGGLIREDSKWFNYDVISDACSDNYALSKRLPFKLKIGSASAYSAIKNTFCRALRNIEIVPYE